MAATVAATLTETVKVFCRRQVIGELTLRNGRLWRRTKSLPQFVVAKTLHMYTKEEFDLGNFQWQGNSYHYQVADLQSKLAVG